MPRSDLRLVAGTGLVHAAAMDQPIALIGFGEAAQAFAAGAGWNVRAYDSADRRADCARLFVAVAPSAREAMMKREIVLNLVTASASLAATEQAACHLDRNALWFDMTSVAPATKRAAATIVVAAGGRYVDAAIMAPVLPLRRGVPILLAGPHAAAGRDALAAAGFADLRVVPGPVGTAAAIKMVRSVMVKGVEALTAECVLAAHRAGVTDEVLASLGPDWAAKADYNLDRMLVHGARRADELDEVATTLAALGIDPTMSRAAAGWQRRLARGGAPAGLAAKLAALDSAATERAA